MRIRDRDVKRIAKAPFQARHWLALGRGLKVYERPAVALARYVTNSGNYPWAPVLKTPTGPLKPNLRDYHDLLTVNEIFCRQDYGSGLDRRVIIDIGANRGLAALFFLSRRSDSRVYCFEPDPANTVRLRETLATYESRYELIERAVTPTRVESIRFVPAGRYGRSATDQDEHAVVVPAIGIADAVQYVLDKESWVDLVKIDTEGSEQVLVQALRSAAVAQQVGEIVFEDNAGLTRWVRDVPPP